MTRWKPSLPPGVRGSAIRCEHRLDAGSRTGPRGDLGLSRARNPTAAARIDQAFSDAVAGLAQLPMLGHPGEIAGTRELTPHRSCRLVYEVVEDPAWILVLIHTARQWRPRMSEIDR